MLPSARTPTEFPVRSPSSRSTVRTVSMLMPGEHLGMARLGAVEQRSLVDDGAGAVLHDVVGDPVLDGGVEHQFTVGLLGVPFRLEAARLRVHPRQPGGGGADDDAGDAVDHAGAHVAPVEGEGAHLFHVGGVADVDLGEHRAGCSAG